MAGLFLLLFIATPLVEIAVFIQAGAMIGLWPTVATVVATAVIGTWLLRRQGLETLRRAQTNLQRGDAPVGELFEGLCLLVAGALLLTPGFVTDAVGFALLVPPVRRAIGAAVLKRLMQAGSVRWSGTAAGGASYQGGAPFGRDSGPPPRQPGDGPGRPSKPGRVIDADYEDLPPQDPPVRG